MVDEHNNSAIDSLSDPECYQLLDGRTVGRIGVIVEQYPLIIPVNYAMDGDAVVIRTAPGTVVAGADGANVTFQVDEFDTETKSGWSVLLRGHATALAEQDSTELIERTQATHVRPWAPGKRPIWMRIDPDGISGRRITPGSDLQWRLGTAAYM